MFIAYTDASIRNEAAYLAFVVIFEDRSKIARRIVANINDPNIAEVLALRELISFLDYYNLEEGLILFDSNCLKSHLKRTRRKNQKYISKNTKEILRRLNIRTQVVPRKYNLMAHRVCYKSNFFQSTPISFVNRHYYRNVADYPDFILQFSVLEEYKQLYNKRFCNFFMRHR